MDNIKITPNKLKGKVNIPPSKSMAHRAIICAALSKGKSVIDNIEPVSYTHLDVYKRQK